MKVLLLHLSDTHFVGDQSRTLDADRIAACVVERRLCSLPAIVAITGDVVDRGCKHGYEVALSFLSDLESSLKSKCGCKSVEFAVVPGNHDCNDEYGSSRRNSLIQELLLKKREFDKSAWMECLTVQKDFHDFRAQLQAQKQPEIPRFCLTTVHPIQGKSLAVTCFNTAFMERAGSPMVQPVLPFYDKAVLQEAAKADLSIALMHHPPSWFKGESPIELTELLQSNYDVVLLGHGHRSRTTTEINAETRQEITFLQGGVLSHPTDQTSMFRLLGCDLAAGKGSLEISEHSKSPGSSNYTCIEEREVPTNHSHSTKFVVNEDFKKELDDLGVSVSHPARDALGLSDVYVYPTLRVISTEAEPIETSFDLRTGEEIIGLVLERKRIRISGGHRSGKTALLRMLYKELLARGFTPVLIHGDHLRKTNPDSLQALGKEMFAEQYSGLIQDATEYLQLDRASKALLVDDLDRSPLVSKPRLRANLMGAMCQEFGVVVACESDASIASLTQITALEQLSDTYVNCSLLRFSPRLQGRMIEKWALLGHTDEENEADFFHRVDELERHVNDLLGSKAYPECPFAVLAVLHFRDSGTPMSIGEGSLASLYRMLIEEELMKSGPQPSVDELRSFLAMIAYYMFSQSKELVTMDEMRALSDEYRKQTDVALQLEKAVSALTSSHTLSKIADGYIFKYSLIYHYFLAFQISRRLHSAKHESQIRKDIRRICGKLDSAGNLHSLQFLMLLLGEDKLVIQPLLDVTRKLLGNSASADLNKDVEFMNRLVYKAPQFVLPAQRDAKLAREEKRRIMEKIEEEASAREEDQDQVNKAITATFHTIDLLGWLVRNHPTTLGAVVKRQVVEELYRLGLRLLADFFSETDSLLADYGDNLEDLLDESLNEGERVTILNQLKLTLFNFGVYITSMVLIAISDALGSAKLNLTLEAVREKEPDLSFKMIDIAIRLGHFEEFPLSRTKEMADTVKGKPLCSCVLAFLVLLRLYYFPEELDHKLEAQLCEWTGIRREALRQAARAGSRHSEQEDPTSS